jgi:Flp pilus assembly protein TadG
VTTLRRVVRTPRRGQPVLNWPRRVREHESDAGNAALELVILTPVIILLICMVIAAGRTSIARGSVAAAARDAARQASISRSPAAALAAARASAFEELNGENLSCSPVVSLPGVDADFGMPLGQSATVRATVRCRVSLSDLLVPGLPGSVLLKASFTSPLDPFRGRTLGLGPAGPAASPASGGIW